MRNFALHFFRNPCHPYLLSKIIFGSPYTSEMAFVLAHSSLMFLGKMVASNMISTKWKVEINRKKMARAFLFLPF